MRHAASKIVSRERLRELLAEHKRAGAKIVFANGCFDTLHVGHVRYLEGARREGDILVVGVNSDSSVCQLERPRPADPAGIRARRSSGRTSCRRLRRALQRTERRSLA